MAIWRSGEQNRSSAEKADWRRNALVDQLGAQQHLLLARRQSILADNTRHALQPRLLFQQRQETPALLGPLRVTVLGPEILQHLQVL